MASKNVIYHHEEWQTTPFRDFVAVVWYKYQEEPLPASSEVSGRVRASVNQGRWVVYCPTDGCRVAYVPPREDPLVICHLCGGETWYRVVYPRAKRGIEAELLRRPALRNRHFEAESRNWEFEETVADLRADNEARGLN